MKKYEFTEEKLKLLLYGQPGSSKTRTAATAALDPRMGKVLMLEAFGNPISIRDYNPKPHILTIERMTDFNDPYEWLSDGQNMNTQFAQEMGFSGEPFQTLIIDGLTEIQRFVTRKVSGGDYVHPGDLAQALTRQGFGQVLGTMLNWAVHFVRLDMNVIITSLEANQVHPDTGIVHRHPLIWGQSGNEIAGYVFMVARLTNDLVGERLLLQETRDPVIDGVTKSVAFFKETPQYYAKDQYGITVDHLTDPTIGKILDLISQSKNEPKLD